ncbi:hypothetical protein EUGRSUZ_E03393 [Eucalyptus grandis]|uniref:Uncharacterized protein n=2 Tax=Eucalyptus grandis TaxID=71139 RepID=A0A059C8U6_EUCGR|nr:hypothetical protein EUGRSUZ_E03393 [Eucalyptus grandis]
MDNNRGGRQATAEEHGIELMKRQLLPSMLQDIEAAPKLLAESAGESNCSIFRVPQALAGGNAEASRPLIVSIGPYHHGEPQLQMLQEHKWRYLRTMLEQTQPHGVGLEDLINTVALKVEMIRQCYSESTECFSGPDLVKMMVVDGCFIIQFLRQLAEVIRMDPPLNNLYVLNSVARDLLRLENQVPYFVLEDLFETTNVPEATWSLANLASHFFSCFDVGPDYVLEMLINIKGVHLLDSFRMSLMPQSQQDNPVEKISYCPLIRSASELRRVGIGFKQGQASTFLGIKFDSKRRTVRIPQIKINDNLNCILTNMVAFEQCRGQRDGHISAYVRFMGCLIHTVDDVQLLRNRKVISNYHKSNQDVICFFGDLCKDISIYSWETYLASHFSFLDKSLKYEQAYLCWAQLLNAFHDNPWSALSGLAVVVMLVGIIQTVYAVLQYYHPK